MIAIAILERGDITFWLATVAVTVGLFAALWRATGGAEIKRVKEDVERVKEDMVTKEDIQKEFLLLREWMRKEFVAKK